MHFAAGCTSAIFFKRNDVNIKPNTYLNSSKGEDSKYIGFDMLKITEDKDTIFNLYFLSFPLSFIRKFVDQNFPRFLGFPTIPSLYQKSKKCRSCDTICKILPSENEQTLVA